MKSPRLCLLALAIGIFCAPFAWAQAPVLTRAQLLELARTGKAAEAFRQWQTQPASPEHSRIGIEIAAASGDVRRGLMLYAELMAATNRPDPQALGWLAVAAAVPLINADRATALSACGIVLDARPDFFGCERLVQSVGGPGVTIDAHATEVYLLANGGYRPWPSLFNTFASTIGATARLQIAERMTRLPASERVSLLEPIFQNDADATRRQEAASLLARLPIPEAETLLRSLAQGTLDPGTRVAVMLALARRGDPAGLTFAGQFRGTGFGPVQMEAMAAIIAGGGQTAGMDAGALLPSAPAALRADLAVAVGRADLEAAKAAVFSMLPEPDKNVRLAALRAAGTLGLGVEPPVYGFLTDPALDIRLATVNAVLQTVETSAVGGSNPR